MPARALAAAGRERRNAKERIVCGPGPDRAPEVDHRREGAAIPRPILGVALHAALAVRLRLLAHALVGLVRAVDAYAYHISVDVVFSLIPGPARDGIIRERRDHPI